MLSGINQSTQMASLLFSKLDTKNQGYIEKSDLASAFSQISSKSTSSSGSSTSVDDVFTALDSNSDGKVTASEFSSVLSKLQDQLGQTRVHGHHGHGGAQGATGTPPPPPPDDAGFTKDELTQQLSATDSTDSARSNLINKIVNNFAAADTDSDGKVSFKEAMAYNKSTQSSTTSNTSSSSTSTSATTTDNSDLRIMKKIMQLMHAYSSGQEQSTSGVASLLSTSA